jgi:hypothetical protein
MDSIPNVKKTIKDSKGEEHTLYLYQELECANGLYDKACEGLDDCPPDIDVWLSNGDQLKDNWEAFKVTVIGQIEHQAPSEEQKNMMCDFLESSTCVYMDLMSSIWVNFGNHIKKHLPVVILPDLDVEKEFPVPDLISDDVDEKLLSESSSSLV